MQSFTERVIAIIRDIPPGTVMTYGQIAACAGSPRGARQVVRILHAMTQKYKLPWHRVINGQGLISIRDDELREIQWHSLMSEGVELTPDGKANLERYRHNPTE